MSDSLLLLDPRNVDRTENASLALGRVKKHPANPLFVEEGWAAKPKAWEARLDNVYPSVIRDAEAGIFKCWYKSFIHDEASEATPPRQRPSLAYFGRKREEGLLYATSEDGIHWHKPELGLIEYAGSRRNNIVMRRATHGLHAGGVLKDEHDADPARRYKFIHRNIRERRMASCFSADGIRWSQPLPWSAHDAVGDTHNNAIYLPELGRYVCVTRGWSGGEFRGERTVLRSESQDFLHWSAPAEILRGNGAHDQIYSMPIAQSGGLFIGLPACFHKGDPEAPNWDTVDTELAISADSLNWRRVCPGEALIPRGAGSYPDGDYDCGCVYAAAPLPLGEQIWLYYGGSNGLHNGWREGSFNLAALPRDRWAGYRARDKRSKAIVRTALLTSQGQELRLNLEVAKGGSIRAALLDAAGCELAGRGFAECEPVGHSGLDIALRWRGSDSNRLPNAPFRLILELERATVYAINGALRADSG